MSEEYGNYLATSIVCFFLVVGCIAFILGASIATAICWWLW
jgi:hypothetical protein